MDNIDSSFINKSTRSNKRRGQIFKASEKSSVKDKWDELEKQYEKDRMPSEKGRPESSEFSHSHTENHSSIRDSMENKRASSEQQDNESVKALLNGYEDLTLDVNAYFQRNYGNTNEVYDENLEQLNDTNEIRRGGKNYY